MDKLWCIQTVEYYSVLKGDELPRRTWRPLKCILPRERKWRCPLLSCVWLSATPWTAAGQAPLSMGLSRQECWSALPSLLQGIFPTRGLNPGLPQWRQILYHLSRQGSPLSERGQSEKYIWSYLHGILERSELLVARGAWTRGALRVLRWWDSRAWSCSGGIHVTVCLFKAVKYTPRVNLM